MVATNKGIFMKTLKQQLGVTLGELVISVSIVAILAGMSAPAYSKFITKRKVAGAANLISVFFESVKMESIKRNEFATISYQSENGGENWCIGAKMGNESTCDCMAETAQCLIGSVPTLLSNVAFEDFKEVQTSFADGTMTFDPIRGILTDPTDGLVMEISHEGEDYRVDVTVNATGRVRKCTPADQELVGFPKCV